MSEKEFINLEGLEQETKEKLGKLIQQYEIVSKSIRWIQNQPGAIIRITNSGNISIKFPRKNRKDKPIVVVANTLMDVIIKAANIQNKRKKQNG